MPSDGGGQERTAMPEQMSEFVTLETDGQVAGPSARFGLPEVSRGLVADRLLVSAL